MKNLEKQFQVFKHRLSVNSGELTTRCQYSPSFSLSYGAELCLSTYSFCTQKFFYTTCFLEKESDTEHLLFAYVFNCS